MKKINILIVTHKKYEFPKLNIYKPIEVNSNVLPDFGYLKDNDGENIADKNLNYCELTAMYWAWKNLDCDIIGINHYRRYLTVHSSKEVKNAKTFEEKMALILTRDDIQKTLKDYDVIVPYTKLYTKTVYTKYCQQHFQKDMDTVLDIIRKDYPDMSSSIDKVMNSKKYAICNMCVMNKELYNEYCKWLFSVLFKLEKNTDMTGYSKLQQRLYGFLSERLFNVWMDYKKLSIKEANMVALEHDNLKSLYNKAWHRILHKKL